MRVIPWDGPFVDAVTNLEAGAQLELLIGALDPEWRARRSNQLAEVALAQTAALHEEQLRVAAVERRRRLVGPLNRLASAIGSASIAPTAAGELVDAINNSIHDQVLEEGESARALVYWIRRTMEGTAGKAGAERINALVDSLEHVRATISEWVDDPSIIAQISKNEAYVEALLQAAKGLPHE